MVDENYAFDQMHRSETIRFIAGVDEVGRGPLAGPVVAAAVILPESPSIYGLRDSKAIPEEQRDALFIEIMDTAIATGIAVIDNTVIDEINILQAALKAMREATRQLSQKPDVVLVDGNQRPGSGCLERPVIKGDSKSAAIMAASILAKVTRDHLMKEAHEQYPAYGFEGHKGYGSGPHIDVIKKIGPCPLHRKSFEPLKSLLLQKGELYAREEKSLPEVGR